MFDLEYARGHNYLLGYMGNFQQQVNYLHQLISVICVQTVSQVCVMWSCLSLFHVGTLLPLLWAGSSSCWIFVLDGSVELFYHLITICYRFLLGLFSHLLFYFALFYCQL